MGKFLIKHFIKDFENTADNTVRESYGKLAGAVGIVTNGFLCIIKIIAGLAVGSIAVIADGINNLTDAASSIITLVGFRLAAIPADEGHPYGHARIEYLTGLIISVLIIGLGVELLKTSIHKVITPDPPEFSWLTVAILAIAILIKVWQALFYITSGKAIHSVTLMATGTDSRNDVISTGVVLASLLVTKFTGLQLDGIMGCIVALFIIWSGLQLIRETSSPLLGESPDPELVNSIANTARNAPGVLGIHDLVVHDYGPGRIFASLHVEVDSDGDLMESHDVIDNIERTLSAQLKIHLTIHMDPVKVGDPLTIEIGKVINELIGPMDGVYGMHDLRIVPGPTHTNLIFDLVLAPECEISESEIKERIEKHLKEINSTYYVVITFDRGYTKLNQSEHN